MTFEEEKFRNIMKGLTDDQRRQMATLLPMEILEAEQEKRIGVAEETLREIFEAMAPYIDGNVQDYKEAMSIVENVLDAIKRGKKRLMEVSDGKYWETEGSNECCKDGCTDHRGKCEQCDERDI